MSMGKRKLLKTLSAFGVAANTLPKIWMAPVLSVITLPAHAMTSSCSNLQIENVDEPITITITDTDVRGPAIALRTGQIFSVEQTASGGLCVDGVTTIDTVIEFSGTIDTATNRISGIFNVRQYCGSEIGCEQIATFTADQVPANSGSDLGVYQGRVIGTLQCCLDLI